MPLYSRGSTRRSLIDTVVFRVISQLAGAVAFVIMIRAMSKQDFGTYSLLYALIPVISTVASLGLEQTLRRYQPEYLRAGNLAAANWLVRFVASARLGANAVLLGTILLAWNYVAPFFKVAPYHIEFAYFSLLALFFFQARILQLSLAAHMLHRFSVGSMAVLALIKVVAYGYLFWVNALTVKAAVIADTIGFACAYAFLLFMYRRYCRAEAEAPAYRPDIIERKRLFKYAAYNNFNDAGTMMLTTKTDNLFIAAILDPVAVAIYSFYSRLTQMASNLLPIRQFENVIQPVFFAVPREEADAKVPQYFSMLLNLNLMLQWPVLAYLAAFHAEIVQVVFGSKYVENSMLLPLMAGFATVNVIAPSVTLVAQYEEKPGIILLSKVFGIVNVIALLVLLPVAGVVGAAIASGLSQALKNGFIWWHVRRRARWTNAGPALIAGLALWLVVVFVCLWLGRLLKGEPLATLCVGAIVIAAACLAHVRSPAISLDDRRILSNVFSGKEARWLQRIGLVPTVDR